MRRRWANPEASNDVDCESFLHVASGCAVLQAYEFEFLVNIFDRIDRTHVGRVAIADLLACFAQLGTETQCEKAAFLFRVFDSDSDGCLTNEQLLHMYCSVTIHSVIARGDQPLYDADILLCDEPSLANARRLYDYTMARMVNQGSDVGELFTFQELWSVLDGSELLLRELVPGAQSIDWVVWPVRGGWGSRAAAEGEGSPGRAQGIGRQSSKELSSRKSNASALAKRLRDSLPDAGGRVDQTALATKSHPGRRTKVHTSDRPARSDKDDLAHKLAVDTENFRVRAAIRFRHAVRGEWDLVDAINAGHGGQDSHDHPRPSTSSLEPSPRHPGGGSIITNPSSPASNSTGPGRRNSLIGEARGQGRERVETLPHSTLPALGNDPALLAGAEKSQVSAAAWNNYDVSLAKRIKTGGCWQDLHKETLSNWSKFGLEKGPPAPRGPADASKGARTLGGSQSLPDLRRETRGALAPAAGGGRSTGTRWRRKSVANPRETASPFGTTGRLGSPPGTPQGTSSPAQFEAAAAEHLAAVQKQSNTVVGALPDVAERFGKSAKHRIGLVSQVLASGQNMKKDPDHMEHYQCQVCGIHHAVCVHCTGGS
jgi:hypothetical protein